MGGSRWDEDHYHSSVKSSVASHGTAFVYTSKIASGHVSAGVHESLDPRNMKNLRRESRDSDAHPNSNSIIVGLDVTGSMGRVVKKIHERLPSLMSLLTRKNYIVDPQILFAGVGDAHWDKAPIQIGQFESGCEMEGDLSKLWLEGGGGGGGQESYELLAYFAARHTSMDCVEKRGTKGYFFMIGDESPYEVVRGSQIRTWFGVEQAEDISTEAIFKELSDLYHVFMIIPTQADNGTRYKPNWQKLVGAQNVLCLENEGGVAELIAAQIGTMEQSVSADALQRDLADVGASKAIALAVAGAVSRGASANRSIAHSDAFSDSGPSHVRRL